MFSNKKSYFFIIPFIIMVIIFFSVIASNFFIKNEKSFNKIERNTTLDIGNREFILKDITKTKEYIYLELVEEDWINNDEVMNIKSNFDNEKTLMDDIIKIRFKGYYFLKIPLNKHSKILNLLFEENDKSYKLFFDTKNYKIEDYEELNPKNYKENYLDFCIHLNNEKIVKINEQINDKNNEISSKEKDIEELKARAEFQIGDELNSTKQKLQNVNNTIENLKDEILNLNNSIVTLKNKNLMIDAEKKYIKTGKKESVVLISRKDKNGNKIDDVEAKELSKKEEEREKQEENKKKNEEKKEDNSSSNSTQNNSKNVTKTTVKKVNSEPKKEVKKELPKQKNNTNNNANSEIKSQKNNKEKGEIEIEFTP